MRLLPDVYKRQVVACDQYTSQPEYWQRVEERVGRAPSSLRLILPESCLDGPSAVSYTHLDVYKRQEQYPQGF